MKSKKGSLFSRIVLILSGVALFSGCNDHRAPEFTKSTVVAINKGSETLQGLAALYVNSQGEVEREDLGSLGPGRTITFKSVQSRVYFSRTGANDALETTLDYDLAPGRRTQIILDDNTCWKFGYPDSEYANATVEAINKGIETLQQLTALYVNSQGKVVREELLGDLDFGQTATFTADQNRVYFARMGSNGQLETTQEYDLAPGKKTQIILDDNTRWQVGYPEPEYANAIVVAINKGQSTLQKLTATYLNSQGDVVREELLGNLDPEERIIFTAAQNRVYFARTINDRLEITPSYDLAPGGKTQVILDDKTRWQLATEQKPKPEMEPEMVFVEGGTFTMGLTSEQIGNPHNTISETPPHKVTVSSFYIGKYEITQAQWTSVMGSNPSQVIGDKLPVGGVSWFDAQEFISRLNEATGKNYRLPTEAEWEYAARGGNKSKGYRYSGSNDANSVAWYLDNSYDSPHPVGSKLPNELGLYDMSGNVWEWCYDWVGDYSCESQVNPQGPSDGTSRVGRGGSWYNLVHGCLTAYHSGSPPDLRSSLVGFRLVLPTSETPPTPTDKGVTINGIKWATCNVDKPGTFATKPEYTGMFYQWNRNIAYPSTGSITNWDNTVPKGTEWEKINDPCPAGWRVPTFDEIETLSVSNKVSHEWTTTNDRRGRRFTDTTTGNSIFFPAAGTRYDSYGGLYDVNAGGYYWSCTKYSRDSAYYMSFFGGGIEWNGKYRNHGFSVRCVEK